MVGPLNAAEIPNRISLAVTPRTALCGSCGPGESDALADGSAPGVAGIVAAGTSALLAGGLFAVSRSDDLEAVCESALRSASAPCHNGFAKMIAIATRAPSELEAKMSQFVLAKSDKRMEAVYGGIVNRII